MPRALASILIGAVMLTGCVAQPPIDTSRQDVTSTIRSPSVEEWLDQLGAVEAMKPAEVQDALEVVDKTASESELFYYGALNQRLQSYGAWTNARDAFQSLEENKSLPNPQRQLARLLRQYNQSRINSHSRYSRLLEEQTELQEGLTQAQNEKRGLEEKIQALTKLETAISTRQED